MCIVLKENHFINAQIIITIIFYKLSKLWFDVIQYWITYNILNIPYISMSYLYYCYHVSSLT